MSDYVAELRALVGDRELLLPSVALIITDDDGRLLLVRSRGVGAWITVGGMVEPGERPVDAAAREALEEVGTAVTVGRLLGTFGGDGYRVRYDNGHRVAYVVTAYEAVVHGDPRPDLEEVDQVGWFTTAELRHLELSTLNRSLLGELGFL